MKKSLLLIVAIYCTITLSKASHVIGGDFQITMTSQTAAGANYHVKLRIYRDDVNGVSMPGSQTIAFFDAVTHGQAATQSLSKTNVFTLVPLGDPCYTPDPNVVRIEEGIFETTTDIFLPNNTNGYYVSSSLSARNSLAINVQTGGTMTWFAMIPDPAIGQNSSPDFGNYPNDAFFCISGPKQFSYPITDADGDSLAYTLVQPLSSSSTSTGPGAGAYPFYNGLNWAGAFNLADIIGGPFAMNINQSTGLITAQPAVTGFFTFAIRVEEYRDTTAAQTGPKVKIGEVRRDVQYISLNCTSGSPPSFLNTVPVMNQTIQIPYNKLYCKDLIFNDINVGDTVYFEMISPIFDSGAYQATMVPDLNGDYHYYYDWNGTSWNDSVVIPPNQFDSVVNADWNITTVADRFCWTPPCSTIDSIYPFQVNAFSLGCDGKSQDSIVFNINVVPPVVNFQNPFDFLPSYGQEACLDIVFKDSAIVDLLNIDVASTIFNEGAYYPSLSTNFTYNGQGDTLTTGVENGAPNTVSVATRFCWTPDCEHIGKTYDIRAVLSSLDCSDAIHDTINFSYTVVPPFDSLDVIPNIFSPNGDGMNDVFTLGYENASGMRVGGTSNPCNDELIVEIYNRWGLLVYETSEPTFQWDGTNKQGKDLPSGTYFLLIKGIFGSEKIPVELEKLTITLMR